MLFSHLYLGKNSVKSVKTIKMLSIANNFAGFFAHKVCLGCKVAGRNFLNICSSSFSCAYSA